MTTAQILKHITKSNTSIDRLLTKRWLQNIFCNNQRLLLYFWGKNSCVYRFLTWVNFNLNKLTQKMKNRNSTCCVFFFIQTTFVLRRFGGNTRNSIVDTPFFSIVNSYTCTGRIEQNNEDAFNDATYISKVNWMLQPLFRILPEIKFKKFLRLWLFTLASIRIML